MTEDRTKKKCPNCEIEFDAGYQFCPHCGQENKDIHLSFRLFLKDYLSAAYLIDSKIFQSIKKLLFRPAEITNEYLKGKRMSQLPPIRMYLVVSLIYFTVITLPHFGAKTDTSVAEADISVEVDSIFQDIKESDLNKSSTFEKKFEYYTQQQTAKIETPVGRYTFIQNLRKYVSTGLFLFIPVNAFLLFILFRRRRPYYIEHFMFVIHLQTAIFIYFTFFNIIDLFYQSEILTVLRLIFGLLLGFLWFKKFYNFGWGKGILLYGIYWFFYGSLFLVFLISVFFISLFSL
jgi:hypothetical protein